MAPDHPRKSDDNPLEAKFNFRVFMFQDMVRGDSLIISAKVVGCIEEEDCIVSYTFIPTDLTPYTVRRPSLLK